MSKYQFRESDIYLPGTDDVPRIFNAELHPATLNGRTTRLFFDPIDYSKMLDDAENAANGYIQVSISCVRAADNNGLRKIIFAGLNKSAAE